VRALQQLGELRKICAGNMLLLRKVRRHVSVDGLNHARVLVSGSLLRPALDLAWGWDGLGRVKVNSTMTLKEPAYDPLLKAVGKVVQEKRLSLGISQEELARRSKLHRTYISDVERGSRSVSLITLCKLAEALHTEASALVQTAETVNRMG